MSDLAEAEIVALLDALAISDYAHRHVPNFACADPFGVYACSWDDTTLAEGRWLMTLAPSSY